MKIDLWPIDRPTPYPDNPRVISDTAVAKVATSLRTYGFQQPIVVDVAGVVIVGHTRLRAARLIGLTEVPVVIAAALSPEQARAYRLADNRTSEEAEWDQSKLLQEVEALGRDGFNLEATAFSPEELKLLQAGDDMYGEGVADRANEAPAGDPDDVPAINTVLAPYSEPGQIYDLGPHRLMCGSSTNAENVAALFGGERIDVVWTDPPYGVAYVGKTDKAMTIQNDNLDEAQLEVFLRSAFGHAVDRCAPGAAWYVASPGGPLFHVFGTVLREFQLWRQTILWVKDAFVLGRQDHHWKHEPMFVGALPTAPGQSKDADPIFYGWKEGKHYWRGGRCQDTVFEVPRPRRNADHPTMKPVALVERCLLNSSRRGAIVYDPFGGSGTTLIAATRCACRARLMELSPVYCDVIRRRWTIQARENGTDPGPGALDP